MAKAPSVRTFDRGASQRIPSGIEAVASIEIRIYGCNLHLTHFHELRAWQTGATIYDNNSPAQPIGGITYDPLGRESRVVTALGYLRRMRYYPWFTIAEDDVDSKIEMY